MSENIAFYNLLVHIVNNDKLVEENVALKNIWGQEGNIMLSLYFYRTKTSQVIDASFIHDTFDLNTEKYYTRCKDLMEDYLNHQTQQEKTVQTIKEEVPSLDFKHLGNIKDDLILLVFIAKCIDYFSDIKKKTIYEYIKARQPLIKNLSLQYIDTYLKALNPTVEEFYEALDNIKLKSPDQAEALAREIVKICVSDGIMAYNEKIYIAEVLQTLREHGVEPDVGL